VVVVPNGLPPDVDMRPTNSEALYHEHPELRHSKIFMFIGRLDTWQKGLDLLIEGFAAAALRDVALVLVGPDCRGSRHSLQALIDRRGLSLRVVLLEPAFGQDRVNLLAAAHMFVHPSRWEGVSLAVLGAAAAGTPCLLTRQADPLGELQRSRAAIVVEPTASSVAEGMRRAAALSASELQTMRARARCVVSAHPTWAMVAERLARAYRLALRRASVRPIDG